MIEIKITGGDFKNIRFAISPVFELIMAYRALIKEKDEDYFSKWLKPLRHDIKRNRFSILTALIRPDGYLPDFLTPPPGDFHTTFEDDISAIKKTPYRLILNDIKKIKTAYGMDDSIFNDFIKGKAKKKLVEELVAFWELALEKYWGKCKNFMESDILHRAKNISYRGLETIFENLGGNISYNNGSLKIDKKYNKKISLGEKGLLMIPSVFSYPHVYVICDEPWTPAVVYPVHDRNMFTPARLQPSPRLQTLAGTTSAIIMQLLDQPFTTLDLSLRTKLTPGAVSQHLGKLYRVDVVSKFRDGKKVFYTLSKKGRAILKAITE